VVKLALPRKGDAAPLAMIEFTRKPGEAVSESDAPVKKVKTGKKAASVAAEKIIPEVKVVAATGEKVAVKVKTDIQPVPEAEAMPETAAEAAPEVVAEAAPEAEPAPEAQAEAAAASEEESKPA
jgi:hypothetical protein